MKTYLIFGAAGSVGNEIVGQLLAAGHYVIAVMRSRQLTKFRKQFTGQDNLTRYPVEDVGLLSGFPFPACGFDGVIYAVGHCPHAGSLDAVSQPLSQLSVERYRSEINMHQVGVLNVFQGMLEGVKDGGCFVFLSSAITRFETFPSSIQAHYHASVIAAEDWLVKGMRHDPTVIERDIKIHRIAPAAVDTSFHHGGPQPPKLLPVSFVAAEVLRALGSKEVVDKQLI